MEQIKTLLERATSELREKMEAYEESYPSSGAALRTTLSKHYFVSDLPYGYVIDIESLYLGKKVNIFDKFRTIN